MVSKRWLDLLGLTFWVALTFGVAAFGSQFEPGDWYAHIAKPAWTPPGWVFGPVWGLLYLLMGVSAWLVWRQRFRTSVSLPLGFYIVQLAVNGLWSWIFFGSQRIGLALIDLTVLVIVVAITAAMFWRVNRRAGYMLLPYLLWISFAAVLNFQIWQMN
ncbi:MAG: tryptophan-rich sensory protein [Phycisphaerales bacterium]|nr:MAG: tryptophan-rich sensory protein [Phycisphaerales bacterium]